MLAFSRLVFGFLNVLALAFSIFQIIFAIIESSGNSYRDCNRRTAWMILWLSVFLLLMSIIGLLASCLRSRVLLTIYLVVAIVVTLVAAAITVFTFAALPKSSANATRQKALEKNWLNQFSPLLREALVNDDDWIAIRNCLIGIPICRLSINGSSSSSSSDSQQGEDEYFLQMGCCVPPKRCGFMQENGTYKETTPKSSPIFSSSIDSECQNWAKRLVEKECYDCDSCKAGYLAQFQADWRANGGIFIGIVVTLVTVTFLSFYILRERDTTREYLEQKLDRIYPDIQNKDRYYIDEISI